MQMPHIRFFVCEWRVFEVVLMFDFMIGCNPFEMIQMSLASECENCFEKVLSLFFSFHPIPHSIFISIPFLLSIRKILSFFWIYFQGNISQSSTANWESDKLSKLSSSSFHFPLSLILSLKLIFSLSFIEFKLNSYSLFSFLLTTFLFLFTGSDKNWTSDLPTNHFRKPLFAVPIFFPSLYHLRSLTHTHPLTQTNFILYLITFLSFSHIIFYPLIQFFLTLLSQEDRQSAATAPRPQSWPATSRFFLIFCLNKYRLVPHTYTSRPQILTSNIYKSLTFLFSIWRTRNLPALPQKQSVASLPMVLSFLSHVSFYCFAFNFLILPSLLASCVCLRILFFI